MQRLLWFTLALVLVGLTVVPAQAHFNILLPASSSARRGQTVTLTYQWGHPFEHQLYHAPQPESVQVTGPDGKTADLTKSLEKVNVPGSDGKDVTAFRLSFQPEARGDYTFVLQTPPLWQEEDQDFLQDTVKVVLHVQAQKGWDVAAPTSFQLVPLTRPYGLLPGTIFQARIETTDQPVKKAAVEVERFNPALPKELPPDEHITLTLRTDPNGVATCVLPESGWWVIAAEHLAGPREHDGKAYPLRQRATLWVFVDPATQQK